MKLRAALGAVMLLCAHFGFAQSLGRYQTCQLQTAQGQAVSGAQVYFLTQPANTAALTPQAQVYGSAAGGAVAQPLLTNGFGECTAYLAPGVYTVAYVSNVTGTLVYPDQNVAVGGGTPTSPAFGAIASGANTGAAMVVGSGASLTPSGAGTIAATAIDGVTVSGTPVTGQAIVATSPTAASWQTVSSSGSTTPAQQYDIPYYSASGAASTLAGAAVNGIVKGRSTGSRSVAASSIDVANVLQGAANCTTAGDVYSPQSNTCVSAGSLGAAGASGDLLYNNAGVVGASAVTTDGAGDSVQPSGSDLNQVVQIPNVTSDLGAEVANAMTKLPTCIDGAGLTHPCGNIKVAPGTYTWSSQQSINGTYVNIDFTGVTVNYTGTSNTSPMLTVTATPYTFGQNTGKIGGPGFNVLGNSSPGISGIYFPLIQRPKIEAGFAGFTGTGSCAFATFAGLDMMGNSNNTEAGYYYISSWNNYYGWCLEGSSPTIQATSGYDDVIFKATPFAGQTALHFFWGNFGVAFGDFHFTCNVVDAGTCMDGGPATGGDIMTQHYTVRMSQTQGTGGTARNFADASISWSGFGLFSIGGNLIDTPTAASPSGNDTSCNYEVNDIAPVRIFRCRGGTPIMATGTLGSGIVYLEARNLSSTGGANLYAGNDVGHFVSLSKYGSGQTGGGAAAPGNGVLIDAADDFTIGATAPGKKIVFTVGGASETARLTSLGLFLGGTTSAFEACTQTNGLCVGTGTTAFSGITTGTNAVAAMVVGSGASLTASGSGSINATQLESRTWEAPGTIGNTTPNTGAFTALSTSGSASLSANPGTNGGIAHTFANTWPAPSSNFATVVSELAPNIASGGNVQHLLGVSGAANNLLQQFFHYVGTGSSGNYVTSQFFGGNSLLALQAAGSVSVSNAVTPCFSQLFAVGSSCQFSVTSAGAMTAASGSTVNGSLICTTDGTNCPSAVHPHNDDAHIEPALFAIGRCLVPCGGSPSPEARLSTFAPRERSVARLPQSCRLWILGPAQAQPMAVLQHSRVLRSAPATASFPLESGVGESPQPGISMVSHSVLAHAPHFQRSM